jgi:chromate transport protein ChrA
MFDIKIILGCIGIGMTIAAHIPYLIQTIKGTNKPHIFTWIIWTLLTFIAAAVQYVGGAGMGAWITGMTGLICIVITAFAFQKGEKNITRSDWAMFIVGLMSIPLWAVTSSPLWSIILITAIDCSAFYPTFRKSWHKPREENTFMYGFNIPRHVVSIFSIAQINMLTVLYPSALLVMNVVMYVMLHIRKSRTQSDFSPR